MADAKTKAQEAKDKAQAALMKASDTKDKVEQSNNDLRDLIKQIRAFLMRESLSPVINYVYDMYLSQLNDSLQSVSTVTHQIWQSNDL